MEHLCMGCMEPLLEGLDVCPCCGYRVGTPPDEAMHLMPGTLLENRYIIGRVIGFGGFGVTFVCAQFGGLDEIGGRAVGGTRFFARFFGAVQASLRFRFQLRVRQIQLFGHRFTVRKVYS